jgi:hypothetical protein
MRPSETMLSQELDQIIARYEIRIEQERIHVRELSADPSEQKAAWVRFDATVAGLAKLQDYRRRFN